MTSYVVKRWSKSSDPDERPELLRGITNGRAEWGLYDHRAKEFDSADEAREVLALVSAGDTDHVYSINRQYA